MQALENPELSLSKPPEAFIPPCLPELNHPIGVGGRLWLGLWDGGPGSAVLGQLRPAPLVARPWGGGLSRCPSSNARKLT